jgi:hypothetical protein
MDKGKGLRFRNHRLRQRLAGILPLVFGLVMVMYGIFQDFISDPSRDVSG